MAYLPQTKEQWERDALLRQGLGSTGREESDIIRMNAEWLLERLYRPSKQIGCVADIRRLRTLSLWDEAINWGDLGVGDVKQYADGSWSITLAEAAPDSVNLCAYIDVWMAKWGWKTETTAEW